ncbi:MAG: PrsW family intramembrane metalloprotease [Candidatus Pacebacteria bacterium]|jgi:RsiW-degrading membrane proteinase PrsW (M82 family)|nr:PrsW family intramembrane metalloprotease [Candidatus Paceibacterota bacterium]
MTHDPNILIVSFLGGLVPALLWLWFWLKNDVHKEPRGLLFLAFVIGMGIVIFVIPMQRLATAYFSDTQTLIVVWAAIEELLKFAGVTLLTFHSLYLDEPVDYPIYFMTTALGFAAFENSIFLIHPIMTEGTAAGLLTGTLRFMGATLLHAVASGAIGVFLGLAFYKGVFTKILYLLMGIGSAIALHSIFNFFIMNESRNSFLRTFGFLWVVTIIIMLLFEKLRRMSSNRSIHI